MQHFFKLRLMAVGAAFALSMVMVGSASAQTPGHYQHRGHHHHRNWHGRRHQGPGQQVQGYSYQGPAHGGPHHRHRHGK